MQEGEGYRSEKQAESSDQFRQRVRFFLEKTFNSIKQNDPELLKRSFPVKVEPVKKEFDVLFSSHTQEADDMAGGSHLIFSEIFDFIEEKKRHNEDPSYIENLSSLFSDFLFTRFSDGGEYSESYFDRLSPHKAILFGARAYRIPEIKWGLAYEIEHRLLAKLSDGNTVEVAGQIREVLSETLGNQNLEILHYCVHLASRADEEGYFTFTEDLLGALQQLKEQQIAYGDHPFFRRIRDWAITEIEREHQMNLVDRDTVGVWGSSILSFQAEQRMHERQEIKERFPPIEYQQDGDICRRISKDCIAIFDPYQDIPQRFAYAPMGHQFPLDIVLPSQPFESFESDKRIFLRGSSYSFNVAFLLRELHAPPVWNGLCRDFQLDLSLLTLREQVHLLSWLANTESQNFLHVQDVIVRFGLSAARAFLSCEHGKHFGDAILDIAKKLDPVLAEAVFAKYCEIVDATERTTEELLSEFYVTENGREIDRGKVNEEILVRAKEVLALCAKELQGAGENPVTGADILKKLEGVQKETILFASLFKDVARNNHIDFVEIKGVTLEQRFGGELAPEERSAMMDIFCENWVQVDPDTFRELKADFEQALGADAQTAFSILKRDQRIIAFIGFESQGDGVVRADYFNTTSTARGALIGEAFLRRALADREQDAREIVAEVAPLADVASAYIERFGFVGVMPDADANAEGKEKWMYLNRSAAIRDALTSRQPSVDLGVIRSWMERGHAPNGIIVEKYAGTSEEDFLGLVRRRLRSGTVLSRYIIEKSVRPPVRYVVFEPVPTAASVSVAA